MLGLFALSACNKKLESPAPTHSTGPEIVVTGSQITSASPNWNLWFEEGIQGEAARYAPVESLEVQRQYTLEVHLSAAEFEGPGVVSARAGAAVLEYLRSAPGDSTVLHLLLLTDARHLVPSPGTSLFVPIQVNTARLLALSATDLANPDPRDPLFDLGAATFALTTTGQAGIATVGLSVWAGGVPIGELSMSICVKGGSQESCDDEDVAGGTASGVENVRVANQLSGRGIADAALHFVALGESTMVGVFRCNTCGWPDDKFLSWRLKSNEAALIRYLSKTSRPAFENAAKFDEKKAFEDAGSDLYRAFFYSEPGAPREAKKAFDDFMASAVASDAKEPHSIFVRFLTEADTPPLYGVPLALMRVPVSRDQYTFIGAHIRVEIPMGYQDYSSHSTCVGSWVLLVPPADMDDIEMREARSPLASWIKELQESPSQGRVYEDLDRFREWLEGDQSLNDEQPVAPTNAALAIVSHHEDNTLFFNSLTKVPNVTSSTIDRVFGPPSVAIINACGSASAGATDFITQFNRAGIPTVIGTSLEVDAKMAGAILSTLRTNLISHQRDQRYSFGRALFDTTKALQAEYGPEVFMYSIFGDDQLRLCPPSVPQSTEDAQVPMTESPNP